MQVTIVLGPNDEFTKSAVETVNFFLDTLAPRSREVNYSKAAEEPDENTVLTTHDEIVSSICSLKPRSHGAILVAATALAASKITNSPRVTT